MHSRILLAAAIICIILAAGCSPPNRAAQSRHAAEKAKTESAYKGEFEKARIIWNDGKGAPILQARFKKALTSMTGDDTVGELQGVNASLYKDGKPASTMIAPKVIIDRKSGEIKATGGVKVVSAVDGSVARSDKMTWKSRDDRLLGAGSVRMTRNNITVTADSFDADTALKKASFGAAELVVK